MNGELLLYSVGEIDDAYILSAAARLGIAVPTGTGKRRNLRRVFTALAAAAVMLFASLTVAMAVNVEFRETVRETVRDVFAFFGLAKTEVVPPHENQPVSSPEEITVEEMTMEESGQVGRVLKGTYVHAPAACHARNGLFIICTDEVEMRQGSHYDAYCYENGEFIRLEEHSFRETITVQGNDILLEFDWVEHNGYSSMTWVEAGAPFRMHNLPGPVNAAMVQVDIRFAGEDGEMTGSEYPVLLDLETGEVTDVLAGTGAEKLSGIANAAVSKDLTKMLLARKDELYYADLTAKKLYDVAELSGEQADACSLVDETLVCWVLEEVSLETGDFGKYRAWAIDLATMERRELFASLPATTHTNPDARYEYVVYADGKEHIYRSTNEKPGLVLLRGFNTASSWGNLFSGSCFAVQVDEEKQVYVIDLATGESVPIEGFRWPERDDPYLGLGCVASPDGKKLLVYGDKQDNYFTYVGVLDFEKKSYVQFERENTNDVNEHTAYWFDNDRIIIGTTAETFQDFYIYSILEG